MIPDKICGKAEIQKMLMEEGLSIEEAEEVIAGLGAYAATTFAVDDFRKVTERIVDWDQYDHVLDRVTLREVEQRLMDSGMQFEELGIWRHEKGCLIFTRPF